MQVITLFAAVIIFLTLLGGAWWKSLVGHPAQPCAGWLFFFVFYFLMKNHKKARTPYSGVRAFLLNSLMKHQPKKDSHREIKVRRFI
jgi:hypothetical protein